MTAEESTKLMHFLGAVLYALFLALLVLGVSVRFNGSREKDGKTGLWFDGKRFKKKRELFEGASFGAKLSYVVVLAAIFLPAYFLTTRGKRLAQ